MKAYTDLSQSKKLAKILPFKSADMKWYNPANDESEFTEDVSLIKNNSEYYLFDKVTDWNGTPYVPCWSLSALLDVLPDKVVIDGHCWGLSLGKKRISYLGHMTFGGQLHISVEGDNLLDACVKMILHLKEKSLI